MTTKVSFYLVKTQKEKLQTILSIAKKHFYKKEPLLFFAPDPKAATFLDELLWKEPETSFLPHCISDTPCKENIVISLKRDNFISAKAVCNLWPTPFLQGTIPLIYELEDLTSPIKKNLSQKKFEAYKEAKYIIESC